jgi:hypothetical protein
MKSVVGLSVFLLLLSAVFCKTINVNVSPVTTNIEIGYCATYTATSGSNDGNVTITAAISDLKNVTITPAQGNLSSTITFYVCPQHTAPV